MHHIGGMLLYAAAKTTQYAATQPTRHSMFLISVVVQKCRKSSFTPDALRYVAAAPLRCRRNVTQRSLCERTFTALLRDFGDILLYDEHLLVAFPIFFGGNILFWGREKDVMSVMSTGGKRTFKSDPQCAGS